MVRAVDAALHERKESFNRVRCDELPVLTAGILFQSVRDNGVTRIARAEEGIDRVIVGVDLRRLADIRVQDRSQILDRYALQSYGIARGQCAALASKRQALSCPRTAATSDAALPSARHTPHRSPRRPEIDHQGHSGPSRSATGDT